MLSVSIVIESQHIILNFLGNNRMESFAVTSLCFLYKTLNNGFYQRSWFLS